jgi:hypothetical protein
MGDLVLGIEEGGRDDLGCLYNPTRLRLFKN